MPEGASLNPNLRPQMFGGTGKVKRKHRYVRRSQS